MHPRQRLLLLTNRMFTPIKALVDQCIGQFNQIPDNRKLILQKIADYITERRNLGQPVQLVYICIHNSRRSHFGQIAAAVAAEYFKVPAVSYSGGTIATAFHPNAIQALRHLGFVIEGNPTEKNPHYHVYFGEGKETVCFSKIYDDRSNPKEHFAAIMTCGEAEENCPFIPNASFKISTTYEDPKSSDGTGKEDQVYRERFQQILTETLYAFSNIKPTTA